MAEATRLTRAGRLAEATALLQRQSPGTARAPGSAPATDARTIDVDPRTGEVLSTAPRAGTRAPAASWHAGAARRDGAGAIARRFGGPSGGLSGGRDYLLYLPAHSDGAPRPLVVMLHGCTQSPGDFATGTGMNRLADELGYAIAYPAQPASANAQKCWNWFNPADQQRDRGEPALIAGITREVMDSHAIDPRRIYVAGLSAGGAAAAIMGQAYPDLYAAIGVHSGLACGAARDIASAFAAMRDGAAAPRAAGAGAARRVPTIVFHADRDGTVHPRNAEHILAQAGGAPDLRIPPDLRISVEHGQVPGGRAYTRHVHAGADGRPMLEQWLVHGGGHAWSGGDAAGSYTDPLGPDASRAMLRFFGAHALGAAHPGAAR